MESKLQTWGARFLLLVLTVLNCVLLVFAGASAAFVGKRVYDGHHSPLMWIAAGTATLDFLAAFLLGPVPCCTNILFRGRHRRLALGIYIGCQVVGLTALIFSVGAYASTEGSEYEWMDDDSVDFINEKSHLAIGAIVAGAVAVDQVLLFVFALNYREMLTQALLTEHNVLYADEEMASDAVTSWEIDPLEVTLGKKIGEGFFGEVFVAEWRRQQVVLKKLKYDVRGKGADAERANFIRELKVMIGLRHPRIVQFLGASTQAKSLFILVEHMANGSLADYTQDPEQGQVLASWSFDMKLKILQDIALGLAYLHGCRPPIIHRDLTPNNVLLDEHWRAKVADFGLSRKSAKKMSKLPGNILYTPPEVMRKGRNYLPSVDVYSWAVVAWELLAGRRPYAHLEVTELAEQVGVRGVRPDLGLARAPAELHEVLRRCWAQEPKERPSTSQLLQMLDEVAGNTAQAANAADFDGVGDLDEPLLPGGAGATAGGMEYDSIPSDF